MSGRLTAPDGLRLATRAWLPDRAPRAAVVVAHGFGEHVARHDRLASELAENGYAVHGYDQRGHGYSPGERANVRRFEELLGDLAAFVRETTAAHPGLPLVAFGHSMGGSVVLRAVQEGLVAFGLIVLSAPLLRSAIRLPRPVERALMALARPFPALPTVALDPRTISRDLAEVEAYRLDPAIYHGPAKGRIAAEMVRHGARALELAHRIHVPVLVLQGSGDQVADAGASGQFARALAQGTIQLFPEGPHELFHDAHRQAATRSVLAWLDERLPSAG